MATTEENKTVKTTEKKVTTPKAKVAAPKVEKKVATPKAAVKKVETKVEDAVNTVKDATQSSVDSVKDTWTDIEDAVKDARVSGNARAIKILNAFFDDKANDKITDFVGYIGEVTAVCSKVMCSPMALPAEQMNTLYKKITA